MSTQPGTEPGAEPRTEPGTEPGTDVIVVLTDQHRADVCAREGFPLDTTPFLDSLGRSGAWFDRAYTTSPLCSPARTSLMTGRYPTAHRVTQNPANPLAVRGADLFSEARAAGYATAMIGKNHTYLDAGCADHWVEFTHDGQAGQVSKALHKEFDAWLAALRHRTYEKPTPFPVEAQNPHRIVDEALSWVATVPADRPLLLVVSVPEPHNPYQVPEPYYSLFPEESLPPTRSGAGALEGKPFSWQYLRGLGEAAVTDYEGAIAPSRSNYFGMLRLIDDELRRLHEGLDDRHRVRERVIVATADHGDFAGEYGLVRKGAEIPDILARVPLVVDGDAVRACDGPRADHVSLADLMPTLCEAMGRDIPAGVQGRSLWPMLTGRPYPAEEFAGVYVEQGMGGLPYGPEDIDVPAAGDARGPRPGLIFDGPDGEPRWDELNAVTQSGRRRKVRSGDWTLYADITGDFRLHDLRDDPLELVDRWSDPEAAEQRVRLLTQLAVWQMRAEDPLPEVPGGYPHKRDACGYLAPYMSRTS
ncbi:sulfatase-like hydrolase/transferase [Streptomyces montanisoli]|uniref:Sulfatase-like hydrolase/transferase n=1 Tax=Streptomyces montanisoli TaxID=2798581 RepID=A0A940MGW3_9ACTN|nr:sulfatase-like hydrolase/transferase [Streptomyces montanisoli]MBP0460984.1 sulfatase-like hydrolase/transferase [Streptomyces montanisoli]